MSATLDPTALAPPSEFIDRFERVRRAARRAALLAALATAVLMAAALFALVAWLDYRYELGRPARLGLLGVSAAAVLGFLTVRAWTVLTRWGRPSTAAELEHRFPQLGQRVRTAVEFGGRDEQALAEAGVAVSLVAALDDDADRQTAPLGLSAVVPTGRMLLASALAAAAVLALFASRGIDPEWDTALHRAALDEVPYTTVEVRPGDVSIDEGGPLAVSAVMRGRQRDEVVLLIRPVGEERADWSEMPLELLGTTIPKPGGQAVPRASRHHVHLASVGEPLEYRVAAGPATSGTFHVDLRYPLSIAAITTEVEPPAYTGLPTKTVADGNIAALAGSRAVVRVELDRAPASASALVRRVGRLEEGQKREWTVPLTPEGHTLTLALDLTGDLRWSIRAKSKDGTELPENAFRARVHEDRPPRITFESPDEQLEVHTLAEVLMRIRVADDYGLTQAGIVFQINNGEAYTLPAKEFAEVASAAAELERTGRLAPPTRSALERVLPLEHFALTQKDCILYYAFAEDNYPDSPHRTETELRFIDVRPFRLVYRLREPGDLAGGGGGGAIPSLGELIRMERDVLNRTLRLDRQGGSWGDLELNAVERVKASQQRIADLTRELSEQLIERGADDVDGLAQAEEAMLGAVDSLSVGKFETAGLQERDAQQYLVEARNALEILLQQSNNAALRNALGQIDRALRQKLRRDRDEDQEQTARSLVARLAQLARTQNQNAAQMAALSSRMQGGTGGTGGTGEPFAAGAGTADDEPMAAAEEPEAPTGGSDEETTEDAMTEESGSGPAGDGPTAEELEARQFDIVTEARELQEELEGTEGVTDLARDRMQAATQTADEAAGAMARGDTDGAAGQAAQAGAQLGELARQVAALLAEEATERVAMSRDMAAGAADAQRRLAGQLREDQPEARAGAGQPDDGRADGRDGEPTPAETAADLAERARTLRDVLQALADSDRPDDSEAADRVSELISASGVERTLDQVEDQPEMVAAGRPEPQRVVEVEDAADRLEAAARDLDGIYRSLVTPRIETLRELEQEAAALTEQMNLLDTPQGVAGWQMALVDLLRELEGAGGGGATGEELSEMADSGTLPAPRAWSRSERGTFTAPKLYATSMPRLVEELRQEIQELVLTDLVGDRDEPTPPEYEHLIEEYLKVLAAEGAR